MTQTNNPETGGVFAWVKKEESYVLAWYAKCMRAGADTKVVRHHEEEIPG